MLKLDDNEIDEIPLGINSMSELKELDLNNNKIKTIPEGLIDIENMMSLIVNTFDIGYTIRDTKELENSRVISLNFNEIEKIPDEIETISEHQLRYELKKNTKDHKFKQIYVLFDDIME